jgi:hypothetical protein
MVRLPAGHGGGGDSSLELLVDGEGKKSDSAAAFFRRGGATVAGDGPATVRMEGKVSSTPRTKNGERRAQTTLTVDEARDRVGRPDSSGIRTRRRRGFEQR